MGSEPTTVRRNAEADESYKPYCMRCTGLVRMQIVERFYWRCAVCKAEHDERSPLPSASSAAGEPTPPWSSASMSLMQEKGTTITLADAALGAALRAALATVPKDGQVEIAHDGFVEIWTSDELMVKNDATRALADLLRSSPTPGDTAR